MQENKIKFAVIGCGYIGNRHIQMINSHSEAELIAVCDIDFKYEYNVPHVSYIEDLFKYDFDVLCVATPNGLHYQHALEAIKNNRHVLIEKPMALKRIDCESLLHKSLQMNKSVFCVMQNRYSPPSEWIKQVITDNILGKIYMVQINCYWNRDERYYKNGWKGTSDMDGGTLFTQFSHFIDIMYWLFGDIYNIQSKFNDFNHKDLTEFEDSGNITFDFISGGSGSFNYSTSVYDNNLESSLTIIAEKGTVKIGGQYMNEVEYCHIKDYVMPELRPSNPANDYGHYKGSAMNHNHVFDNVIDTLKGRTHITTNALEGLKVVDIIERMYYRTAIS